LIGATSASAPVTHTWKGAQGSLLLALAKKTLHKPFAKLAEEGEECTSDCASQLEIKEPFSMDMRDYALLVVPVIVIVYGVFVLFMHPPVKVIRASLAGGLAMALLNIAGDLIAIHTSQWYYNASGLVGQLPLPLYTTSLFITGGLAYLLIWRFWRSAYHWFALLLLVGVPVLGYLRDFSQAGLATSMLVWNGPLAWAGDLLLWLVMFFAGYLVFHAIAPARSLETKPVATESAAALEKQK
jgi:hypothetical protein